VETQLAQRLSRLNPHQQLLGHPQNQRGEHVSPLGSCAAVIFVAATSKSDHSDSVSTASAQLAHQPPLRGAIQGGSFEPQIRRLLSYWVVHREADNANLLTQKLSLAAIYDLEGALPLAVSVAVGETPWSSVPPNVRAMAILVVGRLADERSIEHLEPLLDDETECARRARGRIRVLQAEGGLQVEDAAIEIRDVALAVMVRQSGQELAEYGIHAEPHEQLLFKLATTGFSSDAARSIALTKWRRWRSGDQKQAAEDRGAQPPKS
jgi:hypothetical protein